MQLWRPRGFKESGNHLRRHVLDASWVPLGLVIFVNSQGADPFNGLTRSAWSQVKTLVHHDAFHRQVIG